MKKFVLLTVLISVIALLGCTSNQPGILQGHITIGPLCPVEPCNISQNQLSKLYEGHKILAVPVRGPVVPGIVNMIDIDQNGNYRTGLAPGTYNVDISNCTWLGCRTALPQTVTIEPDKTTTLNIDIDTGIR